MKRIWLTTLFIISVSLSYAQRGDLIIASDSIDLYETYISKKSENNIFPTAYKNGLLYCADGNNGYRLFFTDMQDRKRITGTGIRYVFGPAAVYNDEIYFNKYSTRSSEDGAYNVALYKGTLEDYKITNEEKLAICKLEYAYSHPAISKSGDHMVIVTNEKGLFHLQTLKRNEEGEWVKDEVIYIAQGKGELIHPSFYDDNTIYFAANSYDGGIEQIENIYEGGKLVATDVYRKPSDFDIYKIQRVNGIWRIPNKAAIFNSEFDDLGVVFTDKNKGYLTSFRYNDNDNIYYFELKE